MLIIYILLLFKFYETVNKHLSHHSEPIFRNKVCANVLSITI